jgi:hypothetical protein
MVFFFRNLESGLSRPAADVVRVTSSSTSNDGTKKPEQGLDHGLALAIERRGLVTLLYLASCSELVTTDCVLDYFCVNCGVLCGVCIVGRELCATSAVAGHVLHSTRADRTGMPKSDRRKMSGSCLPCYIAT